MKPEDLPVNSATEPAPTIWSIAQQKCWAHVETATQMMRTLESLQGLHATAVIPILSDTAPSLLITPEGADDLHSIKAVCRYVSSALLCNHEWHKLPLSDAWLLRLHTGSITIDIMTRLPATKESPIEV